MDAYRIGAGVGIGTAAYAAYLLYRQHPIVALILGGSAALNAYAMFIATPTN